MPLLARMLASPLFVDIRPGAIADLAGLLHRRNISADGRVLVAVGRGQGEQIWAQLQADLPRADHFVVGGANLAAAGGFRPPWALMATTQSSPSVAVRPWTWPSTRAAVPRCR